jgi:hypothetical protein
MGDSDRRRRSRSGRVLDALIWGITLGAASGAVLGDAIDGIGVGAGAVIGAALYAPAEAITSIRRGPAEPKPLWHRILSSALLMALFGWVLGLIYGADEPLLTGIITARSSACSARARQRPPSGSWWAPSWALCSKPRQRRRTGADRGGGHDRLSRDRGDCVSRAAAGPSDGRGGPGVGAALRRALRGVLDVRRC